MPIFQGALSCKFAIHGTLRCLEIKALTECTVLGTVLDRRYFVSEVEWSNKALKTLRGFPREVKKEVGFLIRKLQVGKKLKMAVISSDAQYWQKNLTRDFK